MITSRFRSEAHSGCGPAEVIGYSPIAVEQRLRGFHRILGRRRRREQVLITRRDAEVTPNQAAELLGVSRPQVRKMMDLGVLAFRMVGSHHRIAVSSVQAFLDTERPRRAQALVDLADLQNDLGLVE